MNDDWLTIGFGVGVGAVAGILLVCVMFAPCLLAGRC